MNQSQNNALAFIQQKQQMAAARSFSVNRHFGKDITKQVLNNSGAVGINNNEANPGLISTAKVSSLTVNGMLQGSNKSKSNRLSIASVSQS